MSSNQEAARRLSNRDKLLAYLLEHGSASNVQLAQIAGLRFGARLMELRKQGWLVETQDEGRGLVRYRLMRPVPVTSGQQELFR